MTEAKTGNFYRIDRINNLYVDAIVGNDVIFLSAWGLDTAIKEFIAKLSLSPRKGGIQNFILVTPEGSYHEYYRINNAARLQSHTGRSPKQSIFGELVHLWLYDPLTMEVDYANRRCILLKQHTEKAESFDTRLWQTVMNLCPVPLLKEWRFLVKDFREKRWIKHRKGIRVDAYDLDFSSEDVGHFISMRIHEGILSLPKHSQRDTHLSLVK